jgi:D-tyrosyl-tRNA(Tyr) deacylase
MRVLLQKVNHAQVQIDNEVVGQIQKGYLLLVGFGPNDGPKQIEFMVHKIVNMRIFEDPDGKMNLSIKDVDGDILSVSQFTLYADTKHGNRPGFSLAADPQIAEPLYQEFNQQLAAADMHVETGHFGADMKVELENDGPTTIWLEK